MRSLECGLLEQTLPGVSLRQVLAGNLGETSLLLHSQRQRA
jgi:hypothetical protein